MIVAPILAAQSWPTNAELIADCALLGYLRADAHTLDPTYGRGVWWKKWRPDNLVIHDRKIDGTDFQHLDYPDATFDQIAYDPPYVCPGGRKTSTMPDFHDRFGMADDQFRNPVELQALINCGLTEMRRLIRPRGVVLVKCQDYIWGGKLHAGTHLTLVHALTLGFELVDRLERVQPNPRPQPPRNQQQHARRNLSTLFVLRAPRTPHANQGVLL